MFDHHAIVAFVGETAAIVQDVSSGFDPIVTTRECKIASREESLPISIGAWFRMALVALAQSDTEDPI